MAGVLGVVPGIMGLLQTNEALKLLLGIGESLAGRLLLFDALESSFTELKLRRDPDCPVCSDAAVAARAEAGDRRSPVGQDAPFALGAAVGPARSTRPRDEHGLDPAGPARRRPAAPSSSSSPATRSASVIDALIDAASRRSGRRSGRPTAT